MKEHKWTGAYEVLEQHEDAQTAGDRERELQDQYGYPRDSRHYLAVIRMGEKGLANVKYENRVFNNKEHQQKASRAGHLVKLEKGTYDDLGRKKRKLSWSDAEEIRRLCSMGIYQRDVAAQFGISQRSVNCIVNYKTYKHE